MEKVGAYTERATAEGEWRPGDPATGQQATPMLAQYFNMLQRELVAITDKAGIPLDKTDDSQLLQALQAMGVGTGQFQSYSSLRTYSTGEVVRGSDGVMYEFYDRDQAGTVVDVDPTDPANRPHVWMVWDGVKSGATIEWRSETLPEGYVENDGAEVSRSAYRRIFSALGTTYGDGDGSTTFSLPDDRGEFKRGWDHGRGVDSGRALGSTQSDSFRAHYHLDSHAEGGNPGGSEPSGTFFAKKYYSPTSSSKSISQGDSWGSSSSGLRTLETGGDETRPRNIATIYLTKI